MGADEDFVNEAFEEISQMERDEILRNDRVSSALKSGCATYGTIRVGETDVRFRVSINKKLRRKLSGYRSMKESIKDATVEKMEDMVYDIISYLCVDEPWTSKRVWAIYDDIAEVGADEILVQMLQQINSHIEDVKNFRKV